MSKYFVLYNGKANNGKGKEDAETIKNVLKEEIEFVDATKLENGYTEFMKAQPEGSKFVLAGGDGTLNYFINTVDEKDIPDEIYYYPAGSGNDFYHDVTNGDTEKKVINVKKYMVNLPSTTIKGKTSKFINGVGYGIDGYCCEVGDELRKTSDKPINYAGIAIKGLLFHFKPANAKITVDGVAKEYKKVWLSPIMNGRYYGGGMNATPNQDRLNSNHSLSVLVWHGSAKIPTLAAFPGIFKGTHINKKKMCEVLTGKNVTIEYDAPIAAQIDGETVLAVTKVEAKAID